MSPLEKNDIYYLLHLRLVHLLLKVKFMLNTLLIMAYILQACNLWSHLLCQCWLGFMV